MAAGGDKRGEERRLPGPGRGERKEGTSGEVGRPIRPGYQLGHLEKSRGLSLGLNSQPMLDHGVSQVQRSTKYSKFS